jgi:hypothetical protein
MAPTPTAAITTFLPNDIMNVSFGSAYLALVIGTNGLDVLVNLSRLD